MGVVRVTRYFEFGAHYIFGEGVARNFKFGMQFDADRWFIVYKTP